MTTALDHLRDWRDKMAATESGRTFAGLPDRWFDTPTWRCTNGHVGMMYLKSEDKGALCLRCFAPVVLTFPEDFNTASTTEVTAR